MKVNEFLSTVSYATSRKEKLLPPWGKFLTLFLTLFISVSASAQVDMVGIPSATTVNVGDIFTIDIEVQAGTQSLDAAAASLTFDNTVFEVQSVTGGGSLTTEIGAPFFDNVAGTIDYSAGNLSPALPVSGTFTLMTIELEAIAAAASSPLVFVLGGATDAALSGTSYLNTTAPSVVDIDITVNAPPPFQLCIASGSAGLTAYGRTFEADNPASNNNPAGSHPTRTNGKKFAGYGNAIAGTSTPDELLLFQKEIYGGAGGTNPSFTYDIPVSNGLYQVDLYFAEVFHPGPGGRVFDVLLEGDTILDEYDPVNPVKDGLASNQTAITRTYYVDVTDGEVNIQIGPASTDNGKISGLCVTEVSSANLMPTSNINNISTEALVAAALPLSITDPESDALTITFDGLPASLSYNAGLGQLEGTPTALEVGDHVISMIISDGTSSPITEEFVLTIDPPASNNPPVITPPGLQELSLGNALNLNVTITDDNNPSGTVTIYDKSQGGTNNPFSPSTQVYSTSGTGTIAISWTPAASRSYYAIVTANDGVNPPVTETFDINVGHAIPGLFKANSFSSPLPWYGNQPQAPFGVSIETAGNIGWIDNGEFVEYTLDLPTTGPYDIRILASKGNGSTTVISMFEEGNVTELDTIMVPQHAWTQFYDYDATGVVFSNTGLQTLRFEFDQGVNIEDIEFTVSASTAPVASFTAIPSTVDCNQNITFDASGSSHTSGGTFNIVLYEWDFDYDGTTFNVDATGVNPTHSYGTIGTYDVALRVTDNQVPAQTDLTTLSVTVLTTTAPISVVGGPYAITLGDDLNLNGSGSSDPDAACGDNIVSWDWELDGDASFDDASGETPTLTAANLNSLGLGVGIHSVELQVTDATGLTHTSSTTLSISPASTVALPFCVNSGALGAVTAFSRSFDADGTYITSGGSDYSIPAGAPIGGVVTGSGEHTLFRSEKYDNNSALSYAIPTGNGNFTVELYFAELYVGVSPGGGASLGAGHRVFGIDLEGSNVESGIDLFADYGPAVAATKTFNVTVSDFILNIDLAATADNPKLSGICITETSSFVPNAAPTISIAPVSDALDCEGDGESFTLTADANDTEQGDLDAIIVWKDNGGAVVGSGPSFTTPLIIGSATYTAEVSDATPATASQSITVNVIPNTAPTLASIAAAPGTITQGSSVSLSTTPDDAEDGSGALVVSWSSDLENPSTLGTGNNISPVLNATGTHTITASVTDACGETTDVTTTVVVNPVSNNPPVISITAPLNNAIIDRDVLTNFSATVTDVEDDDATLTAALAWSISPFEPNFVGSGGSFSDALIVPGTYQIQASVTDTDGNTVSESITVTVPGPDVTITSPTNGGTVIGTDVQLQWTATNALTFNPFDDHFHIWVNPADPNNLVAGDRISTASQIGQLFWDLDAGDGINFGSNTIVIIVAEGLHTEYTNPEARDEITFAVLDPGVPTASFTATPLTGSCDDPIGLDASGSSHSSTASFGIVQYEWDFDYDGSTFDVDATGVTTNHTYNAFGTFTIALRVTDDQAPALTDITQLTVTLNSNPPVADAGGSYNIIQGADLQLDGSASSDPDGACGDAIVSWEWDLDGNDDFLDANGEQPLVTASSLTTLGLGAGNHTVKLRVTDTQGETNTASVDLTILAAGAPNAAFSAIPNPVACADPVAFDASGSTHTGPFNIVSYEWDFDYDGSTFDVDATGATTSHTFNASATSFDVALRVTDDQTVPATDIEVLTINLTSSAPTADAGSAYTITDGDDLILDGSGSSDPDGACGDAIVSWEWELNGDNSFDDAADAANPTVTAGDLTTLGMGPGTYTVQLRVTDNFGNSNTASVGLTIDAFTVGLPFCINSGGPALTAFGNSFTKDQTGAGGANASPYAVFTANNTYTNANPIAGTTPGSTEEQMYQTERYGDPFSYSVPTGNGNFEVTLYLAELFVGAVGGNTNLGAGDRLFSVDLEGINAFTDLDLFVTYGPQTAVPLTYNVTVTDGVLDIDLSASADNAKLSGVCIAAGSAPVPTASFTALPVSSTCGQQVDFDGSGSSHSGPFSIATYEWDFDYDGSTFDVDATGATPSHTFTGLGSFDVALRVTDNQGSPLTDIAVLTLTVDNSDPISNAGGPYNILLGDDLQLNGSGSTEPDAACGDAIVSWEWDLDGDDDFLDASGEQPLVSAANLSSLNLGIGQQTVKLRVTDKPGGDSHFDHHPGHRQPRYGMCSS